MRQDRFRTAPPGARRLWLLSTQALAWSFLNPHRAPPAGLCATHPAAPFPGNYRCKNRSPVFKDKKENCQFENSTVRELIICSLKSKCRSPARPTLVTFTSKWYFCIIGESIKMDKTGAKTFEKMKFGPYNCLVLERKGNTAWIKLE
jgi:hypothetical protein